MSCCKKRILRFSTEAFMMGGLPTYLLRLTWTNKKETASYELDQYLSLPTFGTSNKILQKSTKHPSTYRSTPIYIFSKKIDTSQLHVASHMYLKAK